MTAEAVKSKICSECSISFTCGSSQAGGECWCNDFPMIMPLNFNQDCRCPECLKKVVKEKVGDFIKTITTGNMANRIPMNYTGSGKLIEGIDYLLENNTWVFTEWYHLKRGNC